MQLCRGQDKHEVLWRLFQNLQQSVKRRRGEHVDLVYNINPLFSMGRRVNCLVPQRPNLVHAVVRGGVQLQHIQKAPALNPDAGRTYAAGVSVHRMLTVDCLRQNFGTGSFTGSPGTRKEIGVGGPILGHLATQGLRNMGLSDHIGKNLGPPFPIKRLIHGVPSPETK